MIFAHFILPTVKLVNDSGVPVPSESLSTTAKTVLTWLFLNELQQIINILNEFYRFIDQIYDDLPDLTVISAETPINPIVRPHWPVDIDFSLQRIK